MQLVVVVLSCSSSTQNQPRLATRGEPRLGDCVYLYNLGNSIINACAKVRWDARRGRRGRLLEADGQSTWDNAFDKTSVCSKGSGALQASALETGKEAP